MSLKIEMEGKPLKGQKKVVHNIGRFDDLDLFFVSMTRTLIFITSIPVSRFKEMAFTLLLPTFCVGLKTWALFFVFAPA